MSITEVGDFIYDTTYTPYISEEDKLRGFTIGGKWEEVVKLYESDPKFSTIKINKSRGTALHVAVNDDNGEVVRILVHSIMSHNNEKALECKNEKGDTPLHLAASRGFKDICECIIGKDGERKYLIDIDNNDGESPMFLAALSWQKQTFVYLFNFKPSKRDSDVGGNYSYSKDLIRNNGDSILHCAIKREFFDLALIIIAKYPNLIGIPNRHGFSPLKLLATRPSAFRSGCKMVWWKRILYHCIPAGILDVEEAVQFYAMKQYRSSSNKKFPKNYDTCYFFLHKCKEYAYPLILFAKRRLIKETPAYGSKYIEEKHKVLHNYKNPIPIMQLKRTNVPENYATCVWFIKLAYIYTLGLSGVGIEEITKMKLKHIWSGQLLNIFMENPNESYLGTGVKPTHNVSGTDFLSAYNPNQGENSSEKPTGISEILGSETAILTAARNGLVEIVDEILTKIPSSIYDVNLENKNVLLVAVENRRAIVVEALKKRFENKKAIFDNLLQGMDMNENTVLHLAATISDRDWHISGSALKMMWHIKWFEYTKGLLPEHFIVRTNKEDKTAEELFEKSCAKLVQEGSAWIKEISESCSVVAVLLAGVAFATSSTVPGGNKSDTGEPILKGKPAFDTFAMSSLIGLCFSVTALIIFLSLLTTQKEAKDFRIDLPRNLLSGLSSLLLSMVALSVAFCSSHFFLIDDKSKYIVFLIYAVMSTRLIWYAVSQLPLYIELLRCIFTKVPRTSDKDK